MPPQNIPWAVRTTRWRKRSLPYLFVLPALLMILFFLALPILWTFYLSFTDWELARGLPQRFVGLQTYLSILSNPDFWNAMRVTFTFMALALVTEMFLGFGLALLLNRGVLLRDLWTTLILVPWMLSPVVVGLQWKFMYSVRAGLINYLFSLIGITPRPWLSDLSTVLPALVAIEVWQQTPFVVMFMLSGLQSLSSDVYEASAIDGASISQQFRYITWPLMRPIVLVVLIIRSIFVFRIFDIIYVTTGGGPANLTQTVAFFSYIEAFQYWHIDKASAVSFIMLIVTVILGLIYIRLLRTEDTA